MLPAYRILFLMMGVLWTPKLSHNAVVQMQAEAAEPDGARDARRLRALILTLLAAATLLLPGLLPQVSSAAADEARLLALPVCAVAVISGIPLCAPRAMIQLGFVAAVVIFHVYFLIGHDDWAALKELTIVLYILALLQILWGGVCDLVELRKRRQHPARFR